MTSYPGAAVGVPRNAFLPSPVFLAVLAVFAGAGLAVWHRVGNAGVAVFVFVVAGWIVSLCLHEYAHALVAYRSGDTGVAARGYLRLNPLKYSHPLLSIGLPVLAVILGGIGLPGGAVWVEHGRIPGRLRHSLVSAAGPLTNVVFAVALAVPFAFGPDLSAHLAFWSALALLGVLQATASVLNFLPVPGLDGGNMIHPWLSPTWQRGYDKMAPFGFLLLFALLWQPQVGRVFFTAVFWLAGLMGLDPRLYALGLELMRFWNQWG
jgi:Zn-dependent protease